MRVPQEPENQRWLIIACLLAAATTQVHAECFVQRFTEAFFTPETATAAQNTSQGLPNELEAWQSLLCPAPAPFVPDISPLMQGLTETSIPINDVRVPVLKYSPPQLAQISSQFKASKIEIIHLQDRLTLLRSALDFQHLSRKRGPNDVDRASPLDSHLNSIRNGVQDQLREVRNSLTKRLNSRDGDLVSSSHEQLTKLAGAKIGRFSSRKTQHLDHYALYYQVAYTKYTNEVACQRNIGELLWRIALKLRMLSMGPTTEIPPVLKLQGSNSEKRLHQQMTLLKELEVRIRRRSLGMQPDREEVCTRADAHSDGDTDWVSLCEATTTCACSDPTYSDASQCYHCTREDEADLTQLGVCVSEMLPLWAVPR